MTLLLSALACQLAAVAILILGEVILMSKTAKNRVVTPAELDEAIAGTRAALHLLEGAALMPQHPSMPLPAAAQQVAVIAGKELLNAAHVLLEVP